MERSRPRLRGFILNVNDTNSTTTNAREIWGILGGMGPLASATFVQTIYEETITEPEQNSPTVILLSNPAIPDRTECLLNGREDVLLEAFSANVGQLVSLGATKIIVACFTIHPLIPKLPESWQKKIISLVDLALDSVLQSKRRHLLVCTVGTRKMELFQRHPLWQRAKNQIVLPGDDDQALIHKMIYEVKNNLEDSRHLDFMEGLLAKYGVDSYLAGCTEIHILAKQHERARGRDRREFCIDPLTAIVSLMSPVATSAPAGVSS